MSDLIQQNNNIPLKQELIIELLNGDKFNLPFYNYDGQCLVACRDIQNVLEQSETTFRDNFSSRKFADSQLAVQLGFNARAQFTSLKDAFKYALRRYYPLQDTINERHANAIVCGANNDVLGAISEVFGVAREEGAMLVEKSSNDAYNTLVSHIRNTGGSKGLKAFRDYKEAVEREHRELLDTAIAETERLEAENEKLRVEKQEMSDTFIGSQTTQLTELVKQTADEWLKPAKQAGATSKGHGYLEAVGNLLVKEGWYSIGNGIKTPTGKMRGILIVKCEAVNGRACPVLHIMPEKYEYVKNELKTVLVKYWGAFKQRTFWT